MIRVQADFENYKKANYREDERYKLRVKEEMLKKLIKHYEDLLRAYNVLDLIEKGESVKKGGAGLVAGRTRDEEVVVFPGDERDFGKRIKVRLTEARLRSFTAERVSRRCYRLDIK